MHRVLLIILSIFSFALCTSLVLAQEDLMRISDISFLDERYRQFLSTYRTQSDAYIVSSKQYYTLKTLASQEEAVRVTRDLFLTRADILRTHFALLSANVQRYDQVPQAERDKLLGEIASEAAQMDEHRKRVDIAINRPAIDEEALWLKTHQKPITELSGQAQTLVQIGALNESLQTLETVRSEIESFVQAAPISETARTEKMRGVDELRRTLTAAQSEVDTVLNAYIEASKRGNSVQGSQSLGLLTSAHTKILRAIEFAKELAS